MKRRKRRASPGTSTGVALAAVRTKSRRNGLMLMLTSYVWATSHAHRSVNTLAAPAPVHQASPSTGAMPEWKRKQLEAEEREKVRAAEREEERKAREAQRTVDEARENEGDHCSQCGTRVGPADMCAPAFILVCEDE